MEALKASGEKSVFPSVYAVRRFCMSCRENSSVCIRASDTSVGSNVSAGAPEAASPGAGVSADAEASGEADGADEPYVTRARRSKAGQGRGDGLGAPTRGAIRREKKRMNQSEADETERASAAQKDKKMRR